MNKGSHFVLYCNCSFPKRPQPLWKHISDQHPDLWVWLGDGMIICPPIKLKNQKILEITWWLQPLTYKKLKNAFSLFPKILKEELSETLIDLIKVLEVILTGRQYVRNYSVCMGI